MTPCSGAEQTLLLVDYDGDHACLYPGNGVKKKAAVCPDGGKAADHFYTGQTWEIDADRLIDEQDSADSMDREERTGRIEVTPLTAQTPVFLETVPEMEDGRACRIRRVTTAAVFAIPVRLC